MTDGSVIATFPEEDTDYIHVIICEVTSIGINVIATDGHDTEIQAYEFATDEMNSTVIVDYLPTTLAWKTDGNNNLLSAVSSDDTDVEAYIYFNVNNGITASYAEECPQCTLIDSTHVFLSESDVWHY